MVTSDLDIRDQLQETMVGHTSTILFGGLSVISAAIAYAVLQNLGTGLLLCLLSLVSTIFRVSSARPLSLTSETIGHHCETIVAVGLAWTMVTSTTNVMCVLSGQTFLVVLASCVCTGLAFGAAINNAPAPRFARTQLAVIIFPYIMAMACVPAPHMRWIFCVAPIWIGGTFVMVQRSYHTNAALIRAQQRVTYLALNDQLTGLANRARILNELQRCCEIAQAIKGRTTYVLFLDLDGFKSVNDSYGHSTGDELLCVVSQRLTAAVRPNDIIGRMGGDEFVAILQDITLQQVQETADRIIARLREPFNLSAARDVKIGVSIGGTSAETHNVGSVLEKADALLYDAKRAGKGTVRLSRMFSGEG